MDPSSKLSSPLLPRTRTFFTRICSDVSHNSSDEEEEEEEEEESKYNFRKRKPVKYNKMIYTTQVLEQGLPRKASHAHESDTMRVTWENGFSTSEKESELPHNDNNSASRGSHVCDSGPEQYQDNLENRLRLRKKRRNKPILYKVRPRMSSLSQSNRRRRANRSYGVSSQKADDSSDCSSERETDSEDDNFAGSDTNSRRRAKTFDLGKVDLDSFAFKDKFADVVGLDHHIQTLTEMILWPLFYPKVFQIYNINPPSGVLFYGPPGTGKTMLVKAFVNEYSELLKKHSPGAKKKVSFYIKSSSDILSKWIGVAEKSLKKLFDEASKNAPSIIFFDELDGLAPMRTAKQDQSHISLVSTLLQLMDGIQRKHSVIVIGATNRIDDIDPALRRVGRFDRELFFDYPSLEAREKLFNHTFDTWTTRMNHYLSNDDMFNFSETSASVPPPDYSPALAKELAIVTEGYCGADLTGLTREAVVTMIRRVVDPKLPGSDVGHVTLQPSPGTMAVTSEDFIDALGHIHGSTNRQRHLSFEQHLKLIMEKYNPDPELYPFIGKVANKYL